MSGSPFDTHEVLNQAPAYAGRNLLKTDPVLRTVLDGVLDPQSEGELAKLGAYCGSQEAAEMARLANENVPRIRTHDAQGRRLDTVDYHPAYHALMRRSAEAGLHCSTFERGGAEAGRRFQLRAARYYLMAQLECGHLCPMTMTNAALATLQTEPNLIAKWGGGVVERRYDHRFLPAEKKIALTLGMGMTEKQGGTDVRANTTRAERGEDGLYRLTGHKWFLSAPMSDAFLVLAQAPEGLSCFLMPRFLPDGEVNGLKLQRLKDKLGNRSNASSEVEFSGAGAWLVGEEGAGVKTIIEMVTLTRLDCAVSSAGLMRAALARAVHHTRHRHVFGRPLVEQPLMTRLLADMALDVAAATALSMRLAHAFDGRAESETEAAFARLMTPAAKYWICKSAPPLIAEAMECLGGNGYIEEGDLARISREAPVNAIWEGSGNVMCLDVMRALEREPEVLDLVLDDIKSDLGEHSLVSVDVLKAAAKACSDDIGSARILTEQLALTAAAAALRRFLPRGIGDAFLYSRLGGQWRATYGMLDGRFEAAGLVDYIFPA
ncbi:MAG: isovaleryl-CoA dehydrogenase [Hyphomicrobiales bacterium]|nr:MAG: isovaleryl-CoA dehydrogenase [Hyphomicrobiales bacterium]